MADFTPLVNGQAYAYADITVTILNTPIAGITDIKYNDMQEITENFGSGKFPTTRGFGTIKSEATLTIDRAELNALLKAAPSNRLQNIGEFDITVSYVPAGSPPVTDIIKNCRFKNTPSGASEGDSNVVAELELAVSHILWAQ
jgi:hypothetical protein